MVQGGLSWSCVAGVYHRHRHNSDLRSADNRHDFRPYVSLRRFAFYMAVHCGFDKHGRRSVGDGGGGDASPPTFQGGGTA